jgi:hypothetical protein
MRKHTHDLKAEIIREPQHDDNIQQAVAPAPADRQDRGDATQANGRDPSNAPGMAEPPIGRLGPADRKA